MINKVTHSNTYKLYKKTCTMTTAGLPKAMEFDDTVAMDLKQLGEG